jgi:hypothetical protein
MVHGVLRRLLHLVIGAALICVMASAPVAQTVFAAAPANDNISSAQRISGEAGALSASTVEATTDVCYALVDHRLRNSIWYIWRAPSSGWLRVATHGSNYDTKVSIHRLTEACPTDGIAGDDDSVLDDGTVVVTTDFKFGVRQGIDYVIGVGGHDAQDRGSVAFGWRFIRPARPPNDDFVHATEIFGPRGLIGSDNAQATTEPGEPHHAGEAGGASLWFKWTAPFSGPVTFNTANSEGDRDTVLAVYRGTRVDALTLVAADDDASEGTSSRLTFNPVAGTTYHLALDTAGGLQTGFRPPSQAFGWRGVYLRWNGGPSPPNDDFADAESLDESHGFLWADTLGATREPGEPDHWDLPGHANEGWGGTSVWYRMVATHPGSMSVTGFGGYGLQTPSVAVYTGTSVSALTLVGENDVSGYDYFGVSWSVTVGETYYIAVDAFGEQTGPFRLSWGRSPPNDDFADARVINTNAARIIGDTAATTREPGEPWHGGVDAPLSAWYAWTPQVSDPTAEISVGVSDGDHFFVGIYTGSTLDALESVPVTRATLNTRTFPAQAGVTYRIALATKLSGLATELVFEAGPGETTPPVITLHAPQANSIVRGALRLTADASDASGVAWVDFFVSPTEAEVGESAGFDILEPFRGSRSGLDGWFYLRARATDAWGNVADTAPVRLYLDASRPGLTELRESVPPPAVDAAEFAWGANEPVSTECSLDAEPFRACTSPVRYAGLADGYHWFLIRATDEAGTTTDGPYTKLFLVGRDPAPPLPSAPPVTPPPEPSPDPGSQPFTDVAGHPFESDIEWLYSANITTGCSPTRFCPDAVVTRAQMASFLVRALELPPTTRDFFRDDERSIHEPDINRLAAAGIASGCGATTFCPDIALTRAQMASFLARGFRAPATTRDYFADDERSVHEPDINRVAAAAITTGCDANRFCPSTFVTRGQMAAFLRRALS